MSNKTKSIERAESQAKAQFESIKKLVTWLEHVQSCDNPDCQDGKSGGDYWNDEKEYHDEDKISQTISEDPLRS